MGGQRTPRAGKGRECGQERERQREGVGGGGLGQRTSALLELVEHARHGTGAAAAGHGDRVLVGFRVGHLGVVVWLGKG